MEPKILSGKECAASVNAETQAMAEKYIAKYGIIFVMIYKKQV